MINSFYRSMECIYSEIPDAFKEGERYRCLDDGWSEFVVPIATHKKEAKGPFDVYVCLWNGNYAEFIPEGQNLPVATFAHQLPFCS